MSRFQLILLLIAAITFMSCTHLNEKINRMSYHTSKSDVLADLGRPFQIKRMGGLDHFIYKFKLDEREYTRAVIFKKGHFLKRGKIQSYPNPENLLEEAENFKEYEEAVKFIKKDRKYRRK